MLRPARTALALALTLAVWLRAGPIAAQETPAPAAPQPSAAPVTEAPPVEAEPEVEPLENPEGGATKAKRTCSTQDVLSGVCTSAEAAQASAQRIWRLMARMELVLPVVWDDTPETETLLYYYAGAEVDLRFVPGLYAVARVGLLQRFWRISGQSPVDFEDPLIGLGYRHSLTLGDAHKLLLVHRLAAYLPASRASRENLFYTTLDWITAARYPFQLREIGSFVVGVDVWSQLAFHQYETQSADSIDAEFSDPGGSNTVFRLEGAGLLQYAIFDRPNAGSLLAETSVGYRYRARLDGSYEPDWYWTLGATYTPITYFSVSFAFEHGYSDLLRGGVPYFVAFDRDETFWRLTLYGRY